MRIKVKLFTGLFLLFCSFGLITTPLKGESTASLTEKINEKLDYLDAQEKEKMLEKVNNLARLELEKNTIETKQAILRAKLPTIPSPQDGLITIKDDFQILQRCLSEKALKLVGEELGKTIRKRRENLHYDNLIITTNLEETKAKIAKYYELDAEIISLLGKLNSIKIPSKIVSEHSQDKQNDSSSNSTEESTNLIGEASIIAEVIIDLFSTKKDISGTSFSAPQNWFETLEIIIDNKYLAKTQRLALSPFFIRLKDLSVSFKKIEIVVKPKLASFTKDLNKLIDNIKTKKFEQELAIQEGKATKRAKAFSKALVAYNDLKKYRIKRAKLEKENEKLIEFVGYQRQFDKIKKQIKEHISRKLAIKLIGKTMILRLYPPSLGGYMENTTNSFKRTRIRETGGAKINFTLYAIEKIQEEFIEEEKRIKLKDSFIVTPNLSGFIACPQIKKNQKDCPNSINESVEVKVKTNKI